LESSTLYTYIKTSREIIMKPIATTLVLPLWITGTLSAQSNETFLHTFVQGTYAVIGKEADTGEPYAGRITITADGERLRMTRNICGETVSGRGGLGKAADDTDVLRMQFSRDGKTFEGTYLIGSDLDNYARLTGYVYRVDEGKTVRVGLEALFFDAGQLVPP